MYTRTQWQVLEQRSAWSWTKLSRCFQKCMAHTMNCIWQIQSDGETLCGLQLRHQEKVWFSHRHWGNWKWNLLLRPLPSLRPLLKSPPLKAHYHRTWRKIIHRSSYRNSSLDDNSFLQINHETGISSPGTAGALIRCLQALSQPGTSLGDLTSLRKCLHLHPRNCQYKCLHLLQPSLSLTQAGENLAWNQSNLS